ncbi:STAS domain-containing protein [Streptomyces sp. NPDC051561]|uniref:STAS domain-containing protein n=1 Tax=Streptomyces sp. NPDC051561 TaxID=3365658 RepID=UPI003794D1C9
MPGSLVGVDAVASERYAVPLPRRPRRAVSRTVRLHGEFTRDQAARLGAKLRAALNGFPSFIEVDFSDVSYLSPDACGPLLRAAAVAQRAGVGFVLTGLSPHDLQTLRTLGAQRLGVSFGVTPK